MNPRQIRRAQERKARKLAAKQNVPSPAALAANRENAQLSTGPRSEDGKRTSSLNAVKTALTGRTVLLPSDDAERYISHVARYHAEYKPVGDRETELVQSLADTQWRLNRIPVLEMGIYAKGRLEFAAEFCTEEPAAAAVLIDAHTLVEYGRELKNLATQEARLRRQYRNDLTELQELQQGELQQKRAEAEPSAGTEEQKQALHTNGFEFSSVFAGAFSSDDLDTLEDDLGLAAAPLALPKAA